MMMMMMIYIHKCVVCNERKHTHARSSFTPSLPPPPHPHKPHLHNTQQILLQTAMSIADEGVKALDPPKPFPPPYYDEEEAEGLINYTGA
jgi:hypothetical protein